LRWIFRRGKAGDADTPLEDIRGRRPAIVYPKAAE
jgi:hypothetical protein